MSQAGLFEPRIQGLDFLDEEPSDMLRWYQREAVESALEKLQEVDSAIIVMATGLGKTQVFAEIAKRWDGNVLVLAHRSELVEQARDRLEMVTGEYVEVEQAELRCSPRTRIVVGSVDTVKQPGRLTRLGADRFSLIIADESHHYVAATYRRPLEFFNAKRLGVTATPDRSDEKALGKLFEEVAYLMDIEDGVADGHLVPLKGRQVVIEEINLDNVDSRAGDLVAGQLDEEMVKGVEGIVAKTLELEPDKQALCFFPGVLSAEYACHAFNAKIPGSAVFVSGSTDKLERRQIFKDFKEGRYLYLCNCQIATEGVDVPTASVVVQARPTKSRSLYAQMVGRVTRVLPGLVDHLKEKHQADERCRIIQGSDKPYSTILDFVGNGTKHALCTVTDVLGGNYDEEEVEKAKKKQEKDPDKDPRQALKEARAEIQAMRKAKARVKASVRDFDPFRLMGVGDEESAIKMRFGDRPATGPQVDALRRMKVPEEFLEELTKRDASKLLDKARERREKGLSSYAQIRRLRMFGVNAENLSFERASAAMDYIAKCGWKAGRISPYKLDAIVNAAREPGEEG